MAANLNWFLRYQMLEHESILCQTEVYNVEATTSQRTMEEEMIQSLFREVYTEHTVKTGLVFPLGIGLVVNWIGPSIQFIQTCEVTFDETMPCSVPVFESAGDQEIGESIFVEENKEDDDWGDAELTSLAAPVESTTTTLAYGPDPSSSTTWGPCEPPPQPALTKPEEAPTVVEGEATSSREAPRHIQCRHPPQTMIGDISQRVTRLRSYEISHFAHSAFVANFEPQNVRHALSDSDWVNTMHEELQNFERNKVWVLVPLPPECHPIGTKWAFKNKTSEDGVVVRNKARLVAQGFCHKERVDFEETFAPMARIEAIRILLAYAASKGFKLYQMDVKSAFLNGYIEKEVYVRQPPGIENHKYPNHIYKLHKALYGLKQAPRAWYERLKAFLVAKVFKMGSVDKTLFLLKQGTDTLLVQIYLDDIIFGGSSHALIAKFSETIGREFVMSMMGELTFFLRLQIKQTREGTFVHQGKYTKDLLRKFDMGETKPLSMPMSTTTALNEDKEGEAVD
jgi:hypothetical protein